MQKILAPVDGSSNSLRAVDHVVRLARECGPLEIHLLNVQPALPGDIATFVPKEELSRYHYDQGMQELASARKRLDDAGIPYITHIGVGDIAETIAGYVREKKIDRVVMGTRGMGSIANLLLGSVAAKVISLVEVPVTLVK